MDGTHGHTMPSGHRTEPWWRSSQRASILDYDRVLIGDPETGERHVIHRAGQNSHTFFASIAFRPTGDRVLFCAVDLDGPNDTRLFTIALDGSDLTLVSDRPACFADWSSTNEIVASAGTDLNKIVTMDPKWIWPTRRDPAHGHPYRSDLSTVTSDGSTVQRLTDTRRSDEYSHSWRSSP